MIWSFRPVLLPEWFCRPFLSDSRNLLGWCTFGELIVADICTKGSNRVPLNFETVAKSTLILMWQSTGCISDEDAYIPYSNLIYGIYTRTLGHVVAQVRSRLISRCVHFKKTWKKTRVSCLFPAFASVGWKSRRLISWVSNPKCEGRKKNVSESNKRR